MPLRDIARGHEVYEACGDAEDPSSATKEEEKPSSHRWIWCCFGPGLMACLADTDAGCIIVAAQSGARWNYSLLLLQVVLIPILFMAQELTIRLGVYTKKGLTACTRTHLGKVWAWFGVALLVVECFAAMLTELAGFAAVVELWGLARAWGTVVAVVLVAAIVILCPYRYVEVIGCVLGLFELVFVLTMFMYHPSPSRVFKGAFTFHDDPAYIQLIPANIGAVIMPWMIYFQQSAIVAKGLKPGSNVTEERAGTLLGTILTQLVMIGTLVTLAAAWAMERDVESVHDIAEALSPHLGMAGAKAVVSLGFLGGSLCAAFVISLAPAWAVCEAVGWNAAFALDRAPTQEPLFYLSFLAVLVAGAIVLLSGVHIVKFDILVELLDGILAPYAMLMLYVLVTGPALAPNVRVTGTYKVVVAVTFSVVSILAIGSMIYSLIRS